MVAPESGEPLSQSTDCRPLDTGLLWQRTPCHAARRLGVARQDRCDGQARTARWGGCNDDSASNINGVSLERVWTARVSPRATKLSWRSRASSTRKSPSYGPNDYRG